MIFVFLIGLLLAPSVFADFTSDRKLLEFVLDFRNYSVFQENPDVLPVDQAIFLNDSNIRAKTGIRAANFSIKHHGVVDLLLSSDSLTTVGGLAIISSGSEFRIIDDEFFTESGDRSLRFFQDRFSVRYDGDSFFVEVGRQAIGLGRSFFFTPNDWLVPFAPGTIDRTYRPGVDAIRLSVGRSDTLLEAIAAFGDDMDVDKSAFIVKATQHVWLTDFDLQIGYLFDEFRYGLGVVSTEDFFRGGAFRLEATYTEVSGEEGFFRLTTGYQRRFKGEIDLLAEYHFNGFGVGDPSKYISRLTSPAMSQSNISLVSQHYLGVQVGVEVTPLVRMGSQQIVNLTDGSIQVGPSMNMSLADNADLQGFFLMHLGRRSSIFQTRSEFGAYPNIYSLLVAFAL